MAAAYFFAKKLQKKSVWAGEQIDLQIEGGGRKWIIEKNMKNGWQMITLTSR